MAKSPSGADTDPQPGLAAAGTTLGPLFPYIWRNSRGQQIIILLVVLASLPFYFLSLDLPRNIVNDAIQGRAFQHGITQAPLFGFTLSLPGWLGGVTISYPGIALSRLAYLLALSSAFMVLVLITGAFRYVINMQKGKIGERLLRCLRLDLFNLLLRFRPEAIRNIRSAEVATIIRDEVEPIGGFVGDAFIQPAFLGSQALTALAFILLQSPLLGIIAAAMVLVQGLIIPRLRREQLRLGRQRQMRSRTLAGHVGEIVDGMAEVSNHGTAPYERQKITNILDELFWIRYDLYGRKFMVKFINSVLAQVTPFLFYSLGGYFALRGSLDIGQLVAVIAAYRDLPPPIKELIDWDQQRQDVQVKYEQILEQFSLSELPAHAGQPGEPADEGAIEVEGLRVRAPSGEVLLDNANLSLPLGGHVLMTGTRGDGFITLAQVLARRLTEYSGKVRIAGHDIGVLPPSWIGANIGYLSPDSTIFGRSLRDNIVYSLLRSASSPVDSRDRIADRHAVTAEDDELADAIDHSLAGAADPRELDDVIITLLHEVGLADIVYGFGLTRRLPDNLDPALAQRLIDCRRRLIGGLREAHLAAMIDSFDPARFNRHATIGENLFFGMPVRDGSLKALIDDKDIALLLAVEGLDEDLAALGLQVAATTVEIFSKVSGEHSLFERFSFISSSDLPRFAELTARASASGGGTLGRADRRALLRLALQYTEARHRLGMFTEALAGKIVHVRTKLMALDATKLAGMIEFYDPARLCAAAPLRDNLLFGRIDHSQAGADERVSAVLHEVVRDCDLERVIFRLGLDQAAGPGGRLLLPAQKSAIGLARCLIKRPKILILDQLDLMFPEAQRGEILSAVRRRMAGRTLIVTMRHAPATEDFETVVATRNNRIHSVTRATVPGEIGPDLEELAGDEQAELQALRDVPMFALLDTPRLKLVAFTSERVSFAKGQLLFRQGDSCDAAYIILSGTTDTYLERTAERLHLSTNGRHSIIGEMGVISGAARSATVIASADVVALKIAKDIFLDLLIQFPPMALAVMRDQIHRLAGADERLARFMLQEEPQSSRQDAKKA